MNTIRQQLKLLADSIECSRLRDTTAHIFNTPDFWTHPGSLSYHHAYVGGLADHTFEVASGAVEREGEYDRDILLTAALWHDYAKIFDYRVVDTVDASQRSVPRNDGFYVQAPYYTRIRHVSGSAIEFAVQARVWGVSRPREEAVVHCILTHHGCREWGSPVEPLTVEAHLLHIADMLSANPHLDEGITR